MYRYDKEWACKIQNTNETKLNTAPAEYNGRERAALLELVLRQEEDQLERARSARQSLFSERTLAIKTNDIFENSDSVYLCDNCDS